MGNIRVAHGTSPEVLGKYLREGDCRHILVIASPRSCRETDILNHIRREAPQVKISQFSDFSPNPDFEEIMQGCGQLTASGADTILAVGGGTAIDIAKSVALLAPYTPDDAKKIIRGDAPLPPRRTAQLLVLPTTAGSGSEATCFAVVYLDGKKYSLAAPCLTADLSIIDGEMTRSMPQALAASSAMDALCQAIESFWARAATPQSRSYARQAIDLLYDHMENAVSGRDRTAQYKVAEAAALAGQAINISKTTAAHAYSYYLTSHHHIPHGHAVALCFPAIALNNFLAKNNCFDDLFDVVKVENIDDFLTWFRHLMTVMGLESDPLAMGFDREKELDDFIGSVNKDRLKNNPAAVNQNLFTKIFFQDSHD